LASNLYEIEPDIITLAKGLGGGVPIAVVMTTHKEILTYGDHGSTFGGNYLSATAGLAVLEVLSALYKEGKIDKTWIYFAQKLEHIVSKYPQLFDKEVGIGLMRGLRANSASIQAQVASKAMEEGLIVLKAGRNTVRFLPSITISQAEIDEGFSRFELALAKIEL